MTDKPENPPTYVQRIVAGFFLLNMIGVMALVYFGIRCS